VRPQKKRLRRWVKGKVGPPSVVDLILNKGMLIIGIP